jgi:hypothetical protein
MNEDYPTFDDYEREAEEQLMGTRTPASCSPDVVEIVERLRGLKNGWVTSQSFSEFIDQAADALESMMRRVDAMRWQTIETAPKDGWILVAEEPWEPGPYDAYAAHWHTDGYWMARCGQHVTESPEPTHWQPLPEPPRAALSDGIEEK